MYRTATLFTLVAAVSAVSAASAQQPGSSAAPFDEGTLPATIESVEIHPIAAADLTCSTHSVHQGDPLFLGDALGSDCTVVRRDGGPAKRFAHTHEGDGSKNEDWFGWGETLLAPFDGVVVSVHLNETTNRPGERGQGPASSIVFERKDGVRVLYGHIDDPQVARGDSVTAGQPVARIGNNGFSWFPHTHLGAWKGREPLQIRFDPRALGRLQEERVRAARK